METNPLTILCGDALEQLRTLPDESVHCCVTSPPYWGLRDYGTAQWDGGEDGCDHAEPPRGGRNPETAGKQLSNAGTLQYQFAHECGKCGAKRIDSQLGLEKTPEEYVARMVEVFREVRRVLRKDGTLWLNLGSNYAGSWGNYGGENRGDGSQREIVTGSKAHQKSYDGLEKWRPPSSFVARRGARACGNDGKGQSDSPASDSACFDLCDECRVAIWNRCDRKSGKLQLSEQSVLLSGETIRDNVHGSQSCSSEVVGVQASTNLESSAQRPLECSHCANCGACLNVLSSASRDSRLCARRASCNSDISQLELERHNPDKDASDSAYSTITFPEFKAKDLVPIPWMVAMALQADGWWLRSDIIWAKPNPMPESVTDRPTKAHEYLFLLTKNSSYFYDAEAIKEQAAYDGRQDTLLKPSEKYLGRNFRADGQSPQSCAIEGAQRWKRKHDGTNHGGNGTGFQDHSGYDKLNHPFVRNKRSVWTVATSPYPEAHFATYPPDLIKPCILAGTSAKGCCARCGSPWQRIVEFDDPEGRLGKGYHDHKNDLERGQRGVFPAEGRPIAKTIGWKPTCKCGIGGRDYERIMPLDTPPTIPCTILDPFAGSGTTGAVALELGRKAVLIELNPKYVELIRQRCNVTMGLALA